MTMVDEAMALMSDGGTWTITPEKQGAADRFIARLREADAAQKRIGELEAALAAADSLARVTRERDALAATHADVMTVLSQYQPGGSPPAGDVLLAQWTLETLARERDAARALAASNAETMRACSREATELDRQLGASRAREAALREALTEYRAGARDCRCGAMGDALAKEST